MINTTLDYSFLESNFVYKFLTRKSGHLNSIKNIEFIMSRNDLEAFLDQPELTQQTVIDLFNNLQVVQEGKVVKSVEDYNPHLEALALLPEKKDITNVFLVRPM